MQATVQDGILCCGGKPIPCEDPALSDYERKKMVIVGINRRDRQIVVNAEKPLAGRRILLVGSSIYCESEKRFVDFSFMHRFEAEIGTDIIAALNSKDSSTYLWVHPQETFLKDYRIGSILTFVEI